MDLEQASAQVRAQLAEIAEGMTAAGARVGDVEAAPEANCRDEVNQRTPLYYRKLRFSVDFDPAEGPAVGDAFVAVVGGEPSAGDGAAVFVEDGEVGYSLQFDAPGSARVTGTTGCHPLP